MISFALALIKDEENKEDELGLSGKSYLVVGFANKKSIAWAIFKLSKARVHESFIPSATKRERTSLRKSSRTNRFDPRFHQEEVDQLGHKVGETIDGKLDGVLHSIAFANYSEGLKPFTRLRGRTSFKLRKYPLFAYRTR